MSTSGVSWNRLRCKEDLLALDCTHHHFNSTIVHPCKGLSWMSMDLWIFILHTANWVHGVDAVIPGDWWTKSKQNP